MSKVFIYGVDGGSFPLINTFIKQGHLPNYKRLIDQGAYGKFISTIPPHTAPGWASISTGVNAGTHGIYQFWKTNGTDYIGSFQGSRDWKTDSLWKILNEYNLKTGVINVPMTHPPKELDGFLISWPLSKTINYCYPKTLLNEIVKAGGHFYPDIYVMYTGQQDYLQNALEITRKRVKTIEYLMNNKQWDFFLTVFPEVDRISHYYWNYMDPNSPYYINDSSMSNAILKIYEEVDWAMGQILDNMPEDTLFVSLSDHGFQVGKVDFNIDTFLVEKGYMTLKSSDMKIEEERNDYQNNFDWFTTTYQGKTYETDWSKTQFFIAAPGSYGVNFNMKGLLREGIVCESEKKDLFEKLKKDLLAVRHPYKDTPLFRNVLWGTDVYKGKSTDLAPDIMLIPDDYSIMVSHHLNLNEIFSEPEQKGMHSEEGYILFYGVGVPTGKILEDSNVADLVPTLLTYYGIDIPEYVEGKSINAFNDDYKNNIKALKKWNNSDNVQQEETKGSYSDEERSDIEQRLKGLGYL